MTFLFVVAHPDDDILGAGAFISSIAGMPNTRIVSLTLNGKDDTRYIGRSEDIVSDMDKANMYVGISKTYVSHFKDSEFHNASHRDMVMAIEKVIAKEKPDVIFTHHSADINSDHYWCAQSALEAARYGQRARYDDAQPVKAIYLMEVPSSTNWGTNSALLPFNPNTYVNVSERDVGVKIEALKMYENVIREHPHPRSEEAIMALAISRGSQAGYRYAEAFQCVFKRGI